MFVSFLLVRDVKWLMVSPSKIIASRPKTARRISSRRGVGRAEAPGKKDPATSARARYTTTTPGTGKNTPTSTQNMEKIIVSNLPTDVNETQIKVCSRLLSSFVPRAHSFLRQELFHSTIGPLKEVTLHYDPAGRSKGVANIVFTRKGDGSKAYQQYNNRLIDGS